MRRSSHLREQAQNTDFLLNDLGDDEKMKESGFIVPQNVPPHSWLKRGVDPPPNRYGIKPGRHLDGVDRSNGMCLSNSFSFLSVLQLHASWALGHGKRTRLAYIKIEHLPV